MTKVSRKICKSNGWSIVWSSQSLQAIRQLIAEDLITELQSFPVTLKDDKRSLVLKGSLFNKQVIAKQPRDKNRRLWSQFLSLFRPAEAKQSQLNLQQFARDSIPAATPLVVLEKHHLGMVIDSWFIYEYLEGVPSTEKDLPKIIELLDRLHKHGFEHNDPHCENFLKDVSGKIHLIDCKGKKRMGNFTDCCDFILLNQYHPEATIELIKQHATFKTDSLGYKLARTYTGYKDLRHRWKKKIRNHSKANKK